MRRKAQQPLKMNPVGLAELTGFFFVSIESKDASVSGVKGYICVGKRDSSSTAFGNLTINAYFKLG